MVVFRPFQHSHDQIEPRGLATRITGRIFLVLRVSITAGLSLETADLWMLSADLLFDIEGDGEKAVGGKVRAGKQF